MSGKIYFITTILSVFLLTSFTAEITASAQTVSINNAEGLPAKDVDLQVSIDDSSGAIGIDITIGYNSSAVVFKSASSGGLIPSGWSVTPEDNGSGSLKVAMFGTTPISNWGVLLNISFKIKPDAAAGTYPVTLDSCQINEESIPTTLINGNIKVLPIATSTTTRTTASTTRTTLPK